MFTVPARAWLTVNAAAKPITTKKDFLNI